MSTSSRQATSRMQLRAHIPWQLARSCPAFQPLRPFLFFLFLSFLSSRNAELMYAFIFWHVLIVCIAVNTRCNGVCLTATQPDSTSSTLHCTYMGARACMRTYVCVCVSPSQGVHIHKQSSDLLLRQKQLHEHRFPVCHLVCINALYT
jgi:hypothetical protein